MAVAKTYIVPYKNSECPISMQAIDRVHCDFSRSCTSEDPYEGTHFDNNCVNN